VTTLLEASRLALDALFGPWDGCVDSIEGKAITAIKEALAEESSGTEQPAIKQDLTPEHPAQQTDEFLLRGILASELKCWHRLTEDEEKNLMAFVQNMGSRQAIEQAEQAQPVALIDAIKLEPTELIHKWRVLELIQTAPPQGIYYTAPLRQPLTDEHVTDGTKCWCEPELDYKDPDTGAEVWIHRGKQ
jgi:hypothetical protein